MNVRCGHLPDGPMDCMSMRASPGFFPNYPEAQSWVSEYEVVNGGVPVNGASSSFVPTRKTWLQGNRERMGRTRIAGGGPKRTNYLQKFGNRTNDGGETCPITTVMLKNIPCRKLQEEVMELMDQNGFAGRYDFLYLPRDVKLQANLGYAFINFLSSEDARQFAKAMNGYRFTGSASSKSCLVVPAHVQGRMNNIAAFKRTEVMRSKRKPFFTLEGM